MLRNDVADEDVAVVDMDGVFTGVALGETMITARSASGLTATARVTVTEPLPAYRALVLGEQNYETGRTRLGGLNTAEGVAETLRQQSVTIIAATAARDSSIKRLPVFE